MNTISPYSFITMCTARVTAYMPFLVRDGSMDLSAGREKVFTEYFKTASSFLCSEIDRISDPRVVMNSQQEARLRNTLANLIEAKRVYQEENDMARLYAERKEKGI